MRLPAFVNPKGDSARQALAALRANGGFAVRALTAGELPHVLAAEVERGAPRVVVAGGDGTIAAAAQVLAGTRTELAIVPAGRLNHFARDHRVPVDPREAIALALGGRARPIDVGRVGDRRFINTSSVGAYVTFVTARQRLAPYLGYRLASLLAAIAVLVRASRFQVTVRALGETRTYETPLVFVGVGERSLGLPSPGAREQPGTPLLHVLVPRPRTTIRGIARRYALAARGESPIEAGGLLADGMLIERCTIELPKPIVRIALDGELARVAAPLVYRIERGALLVVCPAPDDESRQAATE